MKSLLPCTERSLRMDLTGAAFDRAPNRHRRLHRPLCRCPRMYLWVTGIGGSTAAIGSINKNSCPVFVIRRCVFLIDRLVPPRMIRWTDGRWHRCCGPYHVHFPEELMPPAYGIDVARSVFWTAEMNFLWFPYVPVRVTYILADDMVFLSMTGWIFSGSRNSLRCPGWHVFFFFFS